MQPNHTTRYAIEVLGSLHRLRRPLCCGSHAGACLPRSAHTSLMRFAVPAKRQSGRFPLLQVYVATGQRLHEEHYSALRDVPSKDATKSQHDQNSTVVTIMENFKPLVHDDCVSCRARADP